MRIIVGRLHSKTMQSCILLGLGFGCLFSRSYVGQWSFLLLILHQQTIQPHHRSKVTFPYIVYTKATLFPILYIGGAAAVLALASMTFAAAAVASITASCTE